MIGMVMLMGIASKNSILLVEYAIVARRDHGLSRLDALLDACRKRARPIVMTTLAMGAGMLPIALGFGADPSFRAPMAIVVIGGLVTSTVLSLLVIPVLYTCVDDLASRLHRTHRRSPAPASPRPLWTLCSQSTLHNRDRLAAVVACGVAHQGPHGCEQLAHHRRHGLHLLLAPGQQPIAEGLGMRVVDDGGQGR